MIQPRRDHRKVISPQEIPGTEKCMRNLISIMFAALGVRRDRSHSDRVSTASRNPTDSVLPESASTGAHPSIALRICGGPLRKRLGCIRSSRFAPQFFLSFTYVRRHLSGEKHAAAQARNTPDIFTVTTRPSACGRTLINKTEASK
jgi:hypothetical protein